MYVTFFSKAIVSHILGLLSSTDVIGLHSNACI